MSIHKTNIYKPGDVVEFRRDIPIGAHFMPMFDHGGVAYSYYEEKHKFLESIDFVGTVCGVASGAYRLLEDQIARNVGYAFTDEMIVGLACDAQDDIDELDLMAVLDV